MHYANLDAFFHVATHGSQEAYAALYKEFVFRAKVKINQVIDDRLKYAGFTDDFSEFIDELFFDIINQYDESKGSFSYFVDYVFNLRIPSKVITEMKKRQKIVQLKSDDDENFDMECLADPDQTSMVKDIAINNFKYKLASPNRNKSPSKRLADKVALLVYAGYSKVEICRYLKITDNDLRQCIKRMKNDQSIEDLKLDLK